MKKGTSSLKRKKNPSKPEPESLKPKAVTSKKKPQVEKLTGHEREIIAM